MNWALSFNQQEIVKEFSLVQPKQKIPIHLQSQFATRESIIGLGALEAIAKLLKREVITASFNHSAGKAHYHLIYPSSSGKKSTIVGSWNDVHGQKVWSNPNSKCAPWLLVLFDAYYTQTAATTPHLELFQRWNNYLEAMLEASKDGIPHESQAIANLNTKNAVLNAVFAVVDAMYHASKNTVKQGLIEQQDLTIKHFFGQFMEEMLQPKESHVRQNIDSNFSLSSRLSRLAKGGGTALLVGPSGTLKTETASQVALTMGATLVSVSGKPGLEDHQLFGEIVPVGNTAKYVDGPISTAWRAAQNGRTVLVLNELLRFDPHHVGALTGVLDSHSSASIRAMGIDVPEGDRYRVLELPTGEKLVAPNRNLTVIATTNIGHDFVQAGGDQIDAALLGRFDLMIEVSRPEQAVALAIYETVAANQSVAKAVFALEDWTWENSGGNGLLIRASNIRPSMALLKEHKRGVDDGLNSIDAFVEAAKVTLVPYCCPRGSDGLIEDAPKMRLLEKAGIIYRMNCAA